jgi:hypothetical protein
MLHLELHLRTFFQCPIAVHLDCREVNKYIVAVRALDKAIALCGVNFTIPFSLTTLLLTSGAVHLVLQNGQNLMRQKRS